MTKEQLLKTFDHDLLGLMNTMSAQGYSDAEIADYLYDQYRISYWERDILKTEDYDKTTVAELEEEAAASFLTDSTTLNEKLGGKGIETGNLVVFQSPTGEGKTTLLMRLALNAAESGHKVAFISCGEQDIREIAIRMSCIIHNTKYKGTHIQDYTESQRKYIDHVEIPNVVPYYVHDDELDDAINDSINKGIKFIFIDYLGCLFSPDSRKMQYTYLTEVASGLKDKATEYNVCIITAMQTNRQLVLDLGNNPNINPMSLDESYMADSIGVAKKATICATWITLNGMRHLILYKNRPTGETCDIQMTVDPKTYKWNELYNPKEGF